MGGALIFGISDDEQIVGLGNPQGDAEKDKEIIKTRLTPIPEFRLRFPYNETMLQDKKAMQRSMLTNPFEKFERKRFLYYSKDLSVISMNHALYSQMEAGDWERVRRQMEEDLAEYYAKVEGAVLVKR